MDKDFEAAITDFKINLVEYCTLMEDLILPDQKVAYVKIHKIMPFCGEAEVTVTDSLFVNDDECKPTVSGTVSLTDKLIVPVFNAMVGPNVGLPIYSSMIDQEGAKVKIQTGVKIPKGSKMMVLFMDNNINDGYLTNWYVKHGELPD